MKHVVAVCTGLGDLHTPDLDGTIGDKAIFTIWNLALEADPMVRNCIVEAAATKAGGRRHVCSIEVSNSLLVNGTSTHSRCFKVNCTHLC
jgi:hypothetical protein